KRCQADSLAKPVIATGRLPCAIRQEWPAAHVLRSGHVQGDAAADAKKFPLACKEGRRRRRTATFAAPGTAVHFNLPSRPLGNSSSISNCPLAGQAAPKG